MLTTKSKSNEYDFRQRHDICKTLITHSKNHAFVIHLICYSRKCFVNYRDSRWEVYCYKIKHHDTENQEDGHGSDDCFLTSNLFHNLYKIHMYSIDIFVENW